jgi:hypothetical protein
LTLDRRTHRFHSLEHLTLAFVMYWSATPARFARLDAMTDTDRNQRLAGIIMRGPGGLTDDYFGRRFRGRPIIAGVEDS